MIVPITEENLMDAAFVHAEAWRESHKSFCSPEFVATHTTERQADYLRKELAKGKSLWLMLTPEPVGLVSVYDDVIENLYVLPTRQRQGYGTKLLRFAISRCKAPTLWVLSNNELAYRLYLREGFAPTGQKKRLNETLWELEMTYTPQGGN